MWWHPSTSPSLSDYCVFRGISHGTAWARGLVGCARMLCLGFDTIPCMGQSRDGCVVFGVRHNPLHGAESGLVHSTAHPYHFTLHTSTLNTQDNSTTASEEKGPDADALMSHTGNNHRAGFHAAAQLFTAPDSATLCSIYTHLEEALQKPRQPEVTEGHGGEWRSEQMSQWCKLSESDEGDAMCAHGPEIIDKPHWSCCGVEAEGKPCTEGGTAKGGDVYIGQRMPASLLLVSKEDILASAKYIKSRSPELWTPIVATHFGGLLRAIKAKAAEEKEVKEKVPRAYGSYELVDTVCGEGVGGRTVSHTAHTYSRIYTAHTHTYIYTHTHHAHDLSPIQDASDLARPLSCSADSSSKTK